MKGIERLAIFVIVAEILIQITHYLAMSSPSLFEPLGIPERVLVSAIPSITMAVRLLLVHSVIAGWIYFDSPRHRIGRAVWVAFGFVFGLIGLAVYLLRVILFKYELGERPVPTCRRCGYNLTGLTSDKCPECGSPIPLGITDNRAPSV